MAGPFGCLKELSGRVLSGWQTPAAHLPSSLEAGGGRSTVGESPPDPRPVLGHSLNLTVSPSLSRSDYDDWRPSLASLLQPIPFPKE